MEFSFRKQLHRGQSILMSCLELAPVISIAQLLNIQMAHPSRSSAGVRGDLFEPNFTRKFNDSSSMILVKSSLSPKKEASPPPKHKSFRLLPSPSAQLFPCLACFPRAHRLSLKAGSLCRDDEVGTQTVWKALGQCPPDSKLLPG